MNELVRVIGIARLAQHRLGNAAAVNLYRRRVFAHVTLEEGFAHFRDERRKTDHHATDCDQLIDVCKQRVRKIVECANTNLNRVQYFFSNENTVFFVKSRETDNNIIFLKRKK